MCTDYDFNGARGWDNYLLPNQEVRGLNLLMAFANTLLIFVSAVQYPLSEVSEKKVVVSWLVKYNTLIQIIEGLGLACWILEISPREVFLNFLFSIILFLWSIVVFNRAEKNFINTRY